MIERAVDIDETFTQSVYAFTIFRLAIFRRETTKGFTENQVRSKTFYDLRFSIKNDTFFEGFALFNYPRGIIFCSIRMND